MRKLRKIISFALVIAMMVSLFTNCQLPVFATGETESTETTTTETGNTDITLDFVSENNETAEIISAVGQNATIKGTSVNIYKDVYYGAPGMNITVAEGTVIDLVQALEFPSGTVLYYYEYSDNENAANAELYEYSFDYKYISAADITVLSGDAESEATPSPSEEPTATPEATTTPEATVTPEATASPEATATPEVTASPEATTTPEATATPSAEPTTSPEVEDEMSGITDYGSLDFDAYIIPESLTIYKSHMDDVEYVTVADVKGETIHVYYYYELSDNTVKYKVEYTGENTALAAAISGGYTFVKSADVAKIAADSTTGVSVSGNLPQDVTVTVTPADVAELPLENSDITIGENSLFYDVTLMQNGETYTADGDVTVTFPADKVPFASGSTYYAYHIKDDGTVETYGPFEYTGGDIAVEFSSLSYVGIAAASTETTSEIEDIEDFQAIFTTTPVRLYKNQYTDDTYAEDYTEVAVTDADIITVDYQYTFTDSEGNQTVVYSINYTGDNASLREAVAPVDETATTFRFVKAENVTEYVELVPSTTLTDKETGITVEGSLPLDTTIKVEKLTVDDIIIDKTLYPMGEYTTVYEISLLRNGEEYQPTEAVTINFTNENIGFAEYAGYLIYHVHGEEVDVIGPLRTSSGNTSLTVENFSQFIFANIFKEMGSYVWTGVFRNPTVTVYSSYLDGAETYTLENATEYEVTTSMYYDMYDGTRWYKLRTPIETDDMDYAWVKFEDLAVPREYLEDEATGVSVAAELPGDVFLEVSEKTVEEAGINNNIYSISTNSLFYDVTLTQDGEEYQPEDGVVVTLPEENVPLESGKYYSVYHIHDGAMELSGPFEYTGGDLDLAFANLSVVGISESAAPINMIELHNGEATVTTIDPQKVVYFKDNDVTLYDGFESSVYTANITNSTGTEIELFKQYTFPDGTILYQFEYYGSDSDMTELFRTYQFISSEDIAEDTVSELEEGKKVTDEITGIAVTGTLPKDVAIEVEAVAKSDITLDTTLYPISGIDENTVAFNISLSLNGEAYNSEMPVTISLPQAALNLPADSGVTIYHVHDNGDVDKIAPLLYKGKDIDLTVDSFSQFVITSNYEYSSSNGWRGLLNRNTVTVYSSINSTDTYIVENALNTYVEGDNLFTDENGTTWLLLKSAFTSDTGETYVWIKANDVAFINYDGEDIPLGADYTDVAPLDSASITEEATSTYASIARNAVSGLSEDDSLVLYKGVTGSKADGYKITLKAHATGAVTTKTVSMPTDIILVLDQSGSMDDPIGTISNRTTLKGNAGTIYRDYADTIYALHSDGKYYPVTISRVGLTYEYKLINSSGNNRYFNNLDEDIYYKVSDTEYYKVTVSEDSGTYTYQYTDSSGVTHTRSSEERYMISPWAANLYRYAETGTVTGYKYTYVYTDETGNPQISSTTFATTDNITENKYYHVQIDEDAGDDRLVALTNAVTLFANAVANDAKGGDEEYDTAAEIAAGTDDDIHHTISIVGFASGRRYGDTNYNYGNTELFVGDTTYTYNAGSNNSATHADAAQQHYDDAPQDMTTQDGRDNITASIGKLDGNGGTLINLGLEMANGILADLNTEANRYVDENGNTIRNKVVIVFTDGDPGWSGYTESTANEALTQVNTIKNTYGATVYTIGIFPEADARIEISTDGKSATAVATDDTNKFMHYLSSNYKSASATTAVSMSNPGAANFPTDSVTGNITGASYYLSASDSDSLNNIFTQLSQQVGGTSSTLTESAVVKDIITSYFQLPDGAETADIKVYTADYIEPGKFEDTLDWESFDEADITIGKDKRTISVSNFDFSENWVGTETAANGDVTYRGKQLIIEIPIEVIPGFLGGNGVPTNAEGSGVFADSTAEEAVKEFEPQQVDVPMEKVLPVLEDQHIYITNNANLNTMIAGSTDTTDYAYEYMLSDGNIYDFNGVVNKFATVTYTVYEKNTEGTYVVVKTLVIDPEKTSGTWSGSELISDLDKDKTYYITCTVAPSTSGTATAETSDHEPGKVYVYTPEITFKDTGMYYDSTTSVTGTTANNYVSHTWKHESQTYEVTNMHGEEPTLSYTYSIGDVTATTDDVYINVTVTAEGDITRNLEESEVAFSHNDCAGETFDAEKGEFIVHIFRPTVQFKDSNVYLGNPLPTSFVPNTGAITWTHPTVKTTDLKMLNDSTLPSVFYTVVDEEDHVTNDIITKEDDIYVKATITSDAGNDITAATNITHEAPCSAVTDCTYTQPADDSHHFALHVFTPVLTFQDSKVNYGAIVPDYETTNYVETVWKHGTTEADQNTMTGEEPTLTRIYDPVSGKTAPAEDFYVNVTVKVGETNITKQVEFEHSTCNVIDDCSFNERNGEFIVHITSLPLTIYKEFASGTIPEVGETFIFTVKGTDSVTSFVDMTVTLVAKMNDAGQIVVAPITINNLPIGTYTVTEDMAWSWRYKVVEEDGEGGYKDASAAKAVNLGEEQSVTFINKNKNNRWIDSNAYCENEFAAVDENGNAQGTVTKNNVDKQ